MQIGTILAYQYPGMGAHYEVAEDENRSQYIRRWDEAVLGPQPTTDQLRSWWKPAAAYHKKDDFIRTTDRDFGAIFTSRVEFDYIVVRRLQGKTITLEQQAKADRVLALFDKLTRGNGTVDNYVSDITKTAEDIIALSWETV